MQLEQFRYANEIAKCGSITQAAKNLFVSQPSLTVSIKKLEAELGFSLFTRSSKGIQITSKGEEALAIIQQILTLTEDLVNMSPSRGDTLTTMALPVFPTLYDLLDATFFDTMHTKYPHLTCDIIEETANTILQKMRNGSLNFAVSGCPSTVYDMMTVSKNASESKNLSTKILYEEPLLLLIPANHKLTHVQTVATTDLNNETFLYFGEHLHDDQPNILEGYNIHFNEVLPFYRRTSIMKAIVMGQGISIMPESQIMNEREILAGKIKTLTINDFDNTFVHFLIYNKRHIFTKVENDVIQMIEQFYANL